MWYGYPGVTPESLLKAEKTPQQLWYHCSKCEVAWKGPADLCWICKRGGKSSLNPHYVWVNTYQCDMSELESGDKILL